MKTKRGFGGGEGGNSVDGEKSPFRIKAKDPERFVLRIGIAIDPSMIVKLYKFNAKKRKP